MKTALAVEFPLLAGTHHRVRIWRLAPRAVVAAQAHEQVTSFPVQVMAQDHAAKAQVGLHVKQLARVAVADHACPEGQAVSHADQRSEEHTSELQSLTNL